MRTHFSNASFPIFHTSLATLYLILFYRSYKFTDAVLFTFLTLQKVVYYFPSILQNVFNCTYNLQVYILLEFISHFACYVFVPPVSDKHDKLVFRLSTM
jgi:hypothetical protein